jgi:hypothetical protein
VSADLRARQRRARRLRVRLAVALRLIEQPRGAGSGQSEVVGDRLAHASMVRNGRIPTDS